ncbi:MAG TPA: alpha/beta fold hydrolase [Gemmatimonadaceae bacterium]|nr:alpha/beta fold hydrolase [Gemmatimonadaceae bacterium]
MLLPGLDGTGALFDGFVRVAPPGVHPEVVSLPSESFSYAELAECLAPTLRLTPDTVLLAESFSGPLAISLAARHPVAALVLCNTFVAPPRSRIFRAFAIPRLFHMRPPASLVRRYLVGPAASDGLVTQIRAAIESLPPSVLAGRVQAVLTVDVASQLARIGAPILYLRGTEDRLVPESSVRAVIAAASVPVSVVRLAGPHLLLQTSPMAAWDAIKAGLLQPSAAVT